MANTKTVYVARDDSGIFLFSTRPVWEPDASDDPAQGGIWSESGDGKLVLQLSEEDCQDMLGFVPDLDTCWDVSTTSTLIERV